MSLARALTTRRKEDTSVASAAYIGRAASQRAPNAKPIKRSEISLPVALISTTNMLSYEAPDIANAPHVHRMGGRYFSSTASIASSTRSISGDESDHTGSIHSNETDATSLDLSSPELSQEPYTKNAFFKSSPPPLSHRSTASSNASRSPRPSVEMGSPKIPVRAASHSKTAHVLSHKRSIQRMATIASHPSTRETADSTRSTTTAASSHPFGRELEQLNEAAEEFGLAVRVASRSAEAEIDYNVMRAKGLVQYCASDYMDEISSIYSTTFEEDQATYQPMVWI
ncbi:hypothetical protein ANO11243_003130 [Dothideomycetidae sp. 11243]|nr:hypothetical protein ANO11243_003130 [fungal sp. No.11243]